MEISFTHRGTSGRADVEVLPNTDPARWGSHAGSLGLAVCTARLDIAAHGYDAMFGWVQMVRSTDNSSGGRGFDMDPFGPFAGLDTPYCFYGLAPTLFDAPARDTRDDLDWMAHAFLAHTPIGTRTVEPVLGFSWGFRVRSGRVRIEADAPLDVAAEWDNQQALMRTAHPGWDFAAHR